MELVQNTVTVQSNMQFDETFKVGIADDDAAVSMVIERLISAYKNPYLAALREYTSNAYDEHVEAGVSRPVEVSLPSALSPVLKVQDFGRGLTREGLKGFGTIGTSSKRGTNELTGGFGMGSKCALAAAPTFTVVSVRDGKRNTVVVARDENNVPHMNFLAETETTDETGTTVIIPISDASKFGDLTNFWTGWKPGTILVDDEQPKRSLHNPDQYRAMRNGIAYYDLSNTPSSRDEVRVVINQVTYELNYKDLGLTYNQREILKYYVVRLDNGTVEIAPSRETLLYNARTKAAVEARMDAVLSLSAIEQANAITNAPDIKTALTLLDRMRNNGYPTTGIKFNGTGIALPGAVINGNVVPDAMGTWASPHRDHSIKTGWRVDKEFRSLSGRKVWLNYDHTKFVIIHSAGDPTPYGRAGRRKAHREAYGVAEYLSTITPASGRDWNFFITSEPLKRVNRHYRDMADVILSADEFNAVVKTVRAEAAKVAKAESAAKKASRKLVVLDNYSSYRNPVEIPASDIASNYDYTIILRNQDGGMGERFRDSLMTKAHANRTWNTALDKLRREFKVAVVLVGKNDKIDDLLPFMPPVTTFQELAVQKIKASYATASKWDLMAQRDRDTESVDVFRYLKDHHLDLINNKKTVKWAKAVRDYRDTGAETRREFEWLSHYSTEVRDALAGTRSDGMTALPESPIKRYPLLRSVYGHSAKPEDVVDYVNLRDKALKG